MNVSCSHLSVTELRSSALGQIYTVQQTHRMPAETYVVQLAGSEMQVVLCIPLVAAWEADKQRWCCHLLARYIIKYRALGYQVLQ